MDGEGGKEGGLKEGAYIRSMMVIKTPPNLPSKKKAAAGGTSPSFASVAVIGRSSARAESPSVVARVKGMQNLDKLCR